MSRMNFIGTWLALGALAVPLSALGLSTEMPVLCVKEDDCPHPESAFAPHDPSETIHLKAIAP